MADECECSETQRIF